MSFATETSSVIPLSEYVARLSYAEGPLEEWVGVYVQSPGIDHSERRKTYDLSDPDDADGTVLLEATLSFDRLAELRSEYQTSFPWLYLTEFVDLHLRSERRSDGSSSTEILAIDPEWIRRNTEAVRRAHLRALARVPSFSSQATMREQDEITLVEVIHNPDDAWPAVEERLSRLLVERGVAYKKRPMPLDGEDGRKRLLKFLETPPNPRDRTPDVILVVSGGSDHIEVAEGNDIAAAVVDQSLPVVVGMGRGRHGSLLHQVCFAAADTPLGAVELLEDMVFETISPSRPSDRQWERMIDDAIRGGYDLEFPE